MSPQAAETNRPEAAAAGRTFHVVVMGVTGSGKSTIAAELAGRMNYRYADADDFHPRANVEKMASGIPLTDDDRLPWLRALADWTSGRARAGSSTVLACSALKRSYRDVLRQVPGVAFIHLAGPAEVILRRVRAREGHFMPPSLLDSQLATLEPLGPDEHGTVLDLSLSRDELVDLAEGWLTGPGGATLNPDRRPALEQSDDVG